MKRAFTLLELLITIGLIALLAGITIPSLRIVAARADSTTCLSHLRSLGGALSLYLADHGLKMPELEAARADKENNVPVIDNTLDSYVDNQKIFTCPAGRAVAERSGTSYYWNSALNGQVLAALRLFWWSDPGKIPVLLDKEGWHKYVDDKVNHLFADGHVTNELRLVAE